MVQALPSQCAFLPIGPINVASLAPTSQTSSGPEAQTPPNPEWAKVDEGSDHTVPFQWIIVPGAPTPQTSLEVAPQKPAGGAASWKPAGSATSDHAIPFQWSS